MPTITRRHALSQGAVAALCAPAIAAAVPAKAQTPIGAVPASHPDAALIGLCTEFLALDAQIQAWDEGRTELPQATSDALVLKHCRYVRPITETAARTPAGQQIKLRCALAVMRNADEVEAPDRDDLVRAALREAIADGALPSAPNPDADLIAACDAVERLEADYSAAIRGGKTIEEENARAAAAQPIAAQQQPFIDAVATTSAQTLLGLQAKARALTAWAPDLLKPHGDGTNDERMLASLLSDLTRRAAA